MTAGGRQSAIRRFIRAWLRFEQRFEAIILIMEHTPRITVVTPSFNTAGYIEAAMQSVLSQNYPDLEYIVIDGGSTDGTREIIEQYDGQLFYWCSEPDDGQYAAIQKGFKRSTGDIMLWINSDDMLVPGSLAAIAGIFGKFSGTVDWLTGIPAYWDEAGNMFRIFDVERYKLMLLRNGCYEGRAIGWVMQEGTVWTRKLWERAGGTLNTSLTYAGDFELWLRFAHHADLYTVSAVLGGNRRRSGQKTEDDAAYYREVDKVLAINRSLLINRFMRLSPVRKLVRSWLRSRTPRKHLIYDARRQHWDLVR